MCIKNRNVSLVYKIILVFVSGFGLYSYSGLLEGQFNFGAFKYFTVMASVFAFAFYIAASLYVARRITKNGGKGYATYSPGLKGALVMVMLSTLLIYYFTPLQERYSLSAADSVARSTIVHLVVPVMVILDWLLFDRKGRHSFFAPIEWLILPLLYWAFTIVGAWSGLTYANGERYPYSIINVDLYGWNAVIRNMGMLCLVFLTMGYVLWSLDKLMGALEMHRLAKKRVETGEETFDAVPVDLEKGLTAEGPAPEIAPDAGEPLTTEPVKEEKPASQKETPEAIPASVPQRSYSERISERLYGDEAFAPAETTAREKTVAETFATIMAAAEKAADEALAAASANAETAMAGTEPGDTASVVELAEKVLLPPTSEPTADIPPPEETPADLPAGEEKIAGAAAIPLAPQAAAEQEPDFYAEPQLLVAGQTIQLPSLEAFEALKKAADEQIAPEEPGHAQASGEQALAEVEQAATPDEAATDETPDARAEAPAAEMQPPEAQAPEAPAAATDDGRPLVLGFSVEDEAEAPAPAMEEDAPLAEDSAPAPLAGEYVTVEQVYVTEDGQYITADGRQVLVEQAYFTAEGEYVPVEQVYVTEDGYYITADGQYLVMEDVYFATENQLYAPLEEPAAEQPEMEEPDPAQFQSFSDSTPGVDDFVALVDAAVHETPRG